MKRISLIGFAVSLQLSILSGQVTLQESDNKSSIDTLFSLVLQHNPTLRAAAELREASILEARTGNTPADPTVELGYLSGFPEAIGTRLDFRVSQEFDFPTAYFQKARARDIRAQEAELVYALTRQEVLAIAKELWIKRMSLEELQSMYRARLETAEQLKEHYRRMLDAGEVGKLSFSQVNLQLTSLRSDLEEVRAEINVNEEALIEITGGNLEGVVYTSLPPSEIPSMDELITAWAAGPEIQMHAREVELRGQLNKLAVSQSLPSFSAGYYSESVIDERFRGIHVGISIPLWENANQVKHSRARLSQAEAEQYAFRRRQQMELAQQMEKWNGLEKRITELQQALDEVNDQELLSFALEVGEISLSEYIFASEYYFQNLCKLIEYKRDQLLIENDLVKVGY